MGQMKFAGELEADFTGSFPDVPHWKIFVPESPFPIFHFEEVRLAVHSISLAAFQKEEPVVKSFTGLSGYFEAQNIQLIHLWEDVFYQHRALVLSRIKTLLGGNQTIHGRQCLVNRIDKKTADEFLNQNHLQQSASARFKYGLFYGGKLIAVATFSGGKTFDKNAPEKRSHELVRFATLPGLTVNGGLSKLIKAFVREMSPADIMTYADRDWSAGKGYLKLGFKLEKEMPPQEFFVHPDENIRYPVHRIPSQLKSHFAESGKTDLNAFLLDEGYLRIRNSGSLKFRLVL